MISGVGAGSSYLADILPGVTIFALGLAATVAPLTATVLAAASPEHAGVASAVNIDVARTAQLVAVAVLPPPAGISGDDYPDPAGFCDRLPDGVVDRRRRAPSAGRSRSPPSAARWRGPSPSRSRC